MAFLTVMILFTIGNMLIKMKRATLPTPLRVPYAVVLLAFFMMAMGLLGNILSQDPKSITGFLMFGSCFFIPVQVMLNRVFVMKIIAKFVEPCVSSHQKSSCCFRMFQRCFKKCMLDKVYQPLRNRAIQLQKKPILFFTNNDEPPVLLQAIQYFLSNEVRRWYKFVRVYEKKEMVPKEAPQIYKSLQRLFISVNIDYVGVVGSFNPAMVRFIS